MKRVHVHLIDWPSFNGPLAQFVFSESRADVEDHPVIDRSIMQLQANFPRLEIIRYDPDALLAIANESLSKHTGEVQTVSPVIINGVVCHPNLNADGSIKVDSTIALKAEALAFVVSRGYTPEAAAKIVEEHGYEVILRDKNTPEAPLDQSSNTDAGNTQKNEQNVPQAPESTPIDVPGTTVEAKTDDVAIPAQNKANKKKGTK